MRIKKALSIGLVVLFSVLGIVNAAPWPWMPGDMWNIFNREGLRFNASVSDEFNGNGWQTPDTSKWNRYHPTGWTGNQYFTYTGWLAYIHGNQLVCESRYGNPKNQCGIVSSKQALGLGYYEVRAQAANNLIASSFWFYNSQHFEIDVYEHFPHGTWGKQRMKTNLHHFTWDGSKMVDHINWPADAGWMNGAWNTQKNTYGVMREPNAIHYICNGKKIRSVWKNAVAPQHWPGDKPMPVILDILVYSWQHPGGQYARAAQNDYYYIEYFRAWTK